MDTTDRRASQEAAGRWLRDMRERQGLKAGQLARMLNIDPSQLSRYERGLAAVSPERAREIADALGLPEVEVWRGLGLPLPRDDRPPPEDPYWRKLEKLRLDPQDHGLVARLLGSSQERRVNAAHMLIDFLGGRASRERKRQVLDRLLKVERRQQEEYRRQEEEWELAQDVIRYASG